MLLLPRIKKSSCMQKKLQWWKAVKIVSEACPHSSKANARERKKNRSVKSQKLYMDKKKWRKKQQLNERHSLLMFPRSNLVVCACSNCSGNLKGNHGPLVGFLRQIKVLFISRLVIKFWRFTFELAGSCKFDWFIQRTQKSQCWQKCCSVWKLIYKGIILWGFQTFWADFHSIEFFLSNSLW